MIGVNFAALHDTASGPWTLSHAATALRLAKALGTSAQLWLNLQNRFDVETAERAIGKDLAKIVRVTSGAAA